MARLLLIVVAFAAVALPAAAETPKAKLKAVMDSTFGAGNWRQTGGYRTRAREDELRAQGAMTVRPGVVSRHSVGGVDAPGAYDLVVEGLSPWEAAERLRRGGAQFRRILAESAHGAQGPHLHVEPTWSDPRNAVAGPSAPAWRVATASPQELAVTRLRQAALDGDASGQLSLGQAYSQGYGAPKDDVAAYFWISLASINPKAEAKTRNEALRRLQDLGARMKADDLARAKRFAAQPPKPSAACDAGQPPDEQVVVLIGFTPPSPSAGTSGDCEPDA
jgi:hypothetical protein